MAYKHSEKSTGSIKEMAVNFLQLVIAGNIDDAYEKYVDMQGEHHNPYFPADFPALKEAMKENHQQFPNKLFDIQHVIAEGNMAASHSILRMGEKQLAVVHLFRFENGKIVEMWDVAQEIPE
jgi:predicted SnoaL-like aldol condensation-catalyzing enzyme